VIAEATARQLKASGTVYRWDLDKTYLSTDFDSFKGLVRAAFEKAADKRTFPGAQVLLRELCAKDERATELLEVDAALLRDAVHENLERALDVRGQLNLTP
jgi:hypothetical protein